MKTILIPALILSSSLAFALSTEEEAIILNQELQFLEESVNEIQMISLKNDRETQLRKALNTPTLEKRYFGEEVEEDIVSTRTSGLKRGKSKQ
jgi:hypothetical protein